MQALYLHGPGDIRTADVARPDAGPRDVVISTATIGICGSDLGYLAMGGVVGPSDKPIPLGHELCGTVTQVGALVQGFAVGDRVIVNPMFNGIGNGGPEGGFAEHLLIRDVAGQPDSLLQMPAALSAEAGALAEPLAVAIHAVNRSEAKPGDKVAIFGGGTIGLAILAVLKQRGVDDVVLFELSALRRERALVLGARAALDPRERPAAEALAELHGALQLFRRPVVATQIFIDAAGAPGLIDDVITMAPSGATLLTVAAHKKSAMVNFQTIMTKELTLRGSLAYPNEFPQALQLLADGFDLSPIVTHRFRGNEVLQAFATAVKPDEAIKVLVSYND
jgi:(R,R)-butanediol dehydrogenase/meso-butanediol dehydrogenase/diacetyl reductase